MLQRPGSRGVGGTEGTPVPSPESENHWWVGGRAVADSCMKQRRRLPAGIAGALGLPASKGSVLLRQLFASPTGPRPRAAAFPAATPVTCAAALGAGVLCCRPGAVAEGAGHARAAAVSSLPPPHPTRSPGPSSPHSAALGSPESCPAPWARSSEPPGRRAHGPPSTSNAGVRDPAPPPPPSLPSAWVGPRQRGGTRFSLLHPLLPPFPLSAAGGAGRWGACGRRGARGPRRTGSPGTTWRRHRRGQRSLGGGGRGGGDSGSHGPGIRRLPGRGG